MRAIFVIIHALTISVCIFASDFESTISNYYRKSLFQQGINFAESEISKSTNIHLITRLRYLAAKGGYYQGDYTETRKKLMPVTNEITNSNDLIRATAIDGLRLMADSYYFAREYDKATIIYDSILIMKIKSLESYANYYKNECAKNISGVRK